MSLTIKIETKEIRGMVDSLLKKGGAVARDGVKLAFRRTLSAGQAFLRDQIRGPAGGPGKSGLYWRSGGLFRSFRPSTFAAGFGIKLASDSQIAPVHEEGKANIQSKRPGGFLAIPTGRGGGPFGRALTPSGRLGGRFAVSSLRQIPGLFVLKAKSGNLFLAEGRKRGFPRLLFILKQSVSIPARPYVRPTADHMRRVAIDELRKLIARGFGPGREFSVVTG